MADARDKLHHECLKRQIMGISADDFQAKQTDSLQVLADPSGKHSWRAKSWRRSTGKHSRGRVKSIASYFEDARTSHGLDASTDSNWTVHSRDASTMSDATFPNLNTADIRIVAESPDQSVTETVHESDDDSDVESLSSNADLVIDWSTVAPLSPENLDNSQVNIQDAEHDRQLSGYAASTESLGVASSTKPQYQSRITSHADAYSPIRGLPTEWLAGMEEARQGADVEFDPAKLPPQLGSLFKVPLKADDGLGELKSRNGSLIVVKKSQLAEYVSVPPLIAGG